MSHSGKFRNDDEPIFSRGFDRAAMRRQFRRSLAVCVAMSAVALGLTIALPVHTPQSVKSAAPSLDNIGSFRRLVPIAHR
jgi:hypothetical protein